MTDLPTAEWRRSSHSRDDDAAGADEDPERMIAVRDSKDPDGPKLFFTNAEWKAFMTGIKDGEFDLP